VLGVVLGMGAILAHSLMRALGQPVSLGMLAAAQLGVPVAAVTVGTSLGLLRTGEPAALLLGALVTIVAATIAGDTRARSAPSSPESATA